MRGRLFSMWLVWLSSFICAACAGAIPSYPPWQGIADLAPAPMLPLHAPNDRMHGDKGSAAANYPAGFGATIETDGVIEFPDNTSGKIEGGDLYVGGSIVATLHDSGEVSGSGLAKNYRFNAKGELLDGDGRGVRISPEGGVRGIGGKWNYRDVMTWAPEGKKWDYSGWRALTVVSLVLIENMTPEAIRGTDDAPSASPLPLAAPMQAIRGEKGNAPAIYPAAFGATIKPDGSVAFPDNVAGKIKKDGVYAGASPLVTVSDAGEVSGSALKHKYRFNDKGELLDAEGRGVRVMADGGVRGVGGKWRYRTVMAWSSDTGSWDHSGWHAVAIVSLIVIENMAPDALR